MMKNHSRHVKKLVGGSSAQIKIEARQGRKPFLWQPGFKFPALSK